jgi:hypothetical protein
MPSRKVDLWIPAQHIAGLAHIRLIHKHIRKIGRAILNNVAFLPVNSSTNLTKLIDGDHFMSAKVDDLIAKRLECGNRSAGDVIHVGEAA